MNAPRTVTRLLRDVQQGNELARAELFKVLYAELHLRARHLARQHPKQITLQATALVHEAYLSLVQESDGSFANRDHFIACAARAMRNILIDHVRRRRSNTNEDLLLDALVAAFEERAFDMERLEAALKELQESNPEMAEAVELRFFGGASEEEAARILNIPYRTFQRRWRSALQWLKEKCNDA
jgi:RNA polymerase sigma-70 factor, ECF subfamily